MTYPNHAGNKSKPLKHKNVARLRGEEKLFVLLQMKKTRMVRVMLQDLELTIKLMLVERPLMDPINLYYKM